MNDFDKCRLSRLMMEMTIVVQLVSYDERRGLANAGSRVIEKARMRAREEVEYGEVDRTRWAS